MTPSHVDWVPPESFDEYRLVKALGRGSMGQVWLAHDTVLDRPVAVKFIAARSAHEAVRQRFLTEARAAARVQHPNIIAVFRVGELGQRPYLISEYVGGTSLDKIARPVAWPRLLELAIGLARGLAAAHGRGVLHRDLKPANAIVSETGEVKLLDFGLAKLLPHVEPPHANAPPDRERTAATPSISDEGMRALPANRAPFGVPSDLNARTVEVVTGAGMKVPDGGIAPPEITCAGALMGTPAYMPPEIWRGEPATQRSDVYSLGALLYELGAGAPPHRGGSPEAVRRSATATDAPSLAVAAPGVDPRLVAIVDRCLRRDPTERFASGAAVLEALETLAAGDDTMARAHARARARPSRNRPPPRSWWAIVLGAALAVALFAYHRSGGERSPPPIGAAVTKHALPDVPAQDSQASWEARGSRLIGVMERCPDGMVSVPAGTFLMGSPEGEGDTDEHPQHEVTLSAYCIDKTEVTVAVYAACVAARRCSAPLLTTNLSVYTAEEVKRFNRLCNRNDRLDHPINCVDWNQAAAYCAWQGQRLPTEAEWEYAARGNDGRVYPWGNEAPDAKRLNVCEDECVVELTMVVGHYPEGRSPFGVLDMAGNVAEWTADWYGSYTTQAETNPQGPSAGHSRVTRGGGSGGVGVGNGIGWTLTNRVTDRSWPDPEDRAVDLGFRCAVGVDAARPL